MLREGAVSEQITPGTEADRINQLATHIAEAMDMANALELLDIEARLRRSHADVCRELKFKLEDERERASQIG